MRGELKYQVMAVADSLGVSVAIWCCLIVSSVAALRFI
jgi:hypothetical protein